MPMRTPAEEDSHSASYDRLIDVFWFFEGKRAAGSFDQ